MAYYFLHPRRGVSPSLAAAVVLAIFSSAANAEAPNGKFAFGTVSVEEDGNPGEQDPRCSGSLAASSIEGDGQTKFLIELPSLTIVGHRSPGRDFESSIFTGGAVVVLDSPGSSTGRLSFFHPGVAGTPTSRPEVSAKNFRVSDYRVVKESLNLANIKMKVTLDINVATCTLAIKGFFRRL